MQIVEIPILNLKLKISKIAFNIFGIDIYWYALIIVVSIVSALFYCKKIKGKYGIKFETILNVCILVIPIGIICARLYYVIFNLKYFIENPMQILDIRDGGLAIYGGIIGGIVTIILYCKKHEINLFDLLDYLAPAVALAQSIGRWGNFVNIEAYGTQTSLPWKMCIIENEIKKCVHPTFLYESLWCLIGFIVLLLFRRRYYCKIGQTTGLYLIWYGIGRFFIEALRTDSLMLGSFKVAQIVSVLAVVIGLVIIIVKSRGSKLNNRYNDKENVDEIRF